MLRRYIIHHLKILSKQIFSQENIHIFDIDENYNNIIIPENKKNIKYDLIIVSHLWGKYLNITNITNNYTDAFIVEDVVLGGEYINEYNNNSDLIFHSTGMDKRPTSIFGGYVQIKNIHNNLIKDINHSINKLNLPSRTEICKKIFDNIILNIIYNIRPIQNFIKLIINFTQTKLNNVVTKFRINKPGFSHNNYMRKPTKLMTEINKSLYDTHYDNEQIFIKKIKFFLYNSHKIK